MTRILKTDALVRVTNIWRACREHFPGWVIAPAEARESLWTRTEYWLDYIPASLPRAEPEIALSLLYETIWRMETSLNPLYLNHVEMATTVLARINPSPRLLPWPSIEGPVYNEANNRCDLLEAWVEIAFSLMREARDDLDLLRFNEWHSRLEQVSNERPHWLARWHYEKALMTLWRFDFAGLETALLTWPTQLEDLPFWETRRAALWAELGETERAENLTEESLQTIRARLPAEIVDYRLLSQEGWALRLLMTLKQRGMNQMPEHERVRFQQRFTELNRYKCDPWEITEWMELALKGPQPNLLPVRSLRRGFDPGSVTGSSHFSRHGPTEQARPAFAYLRVLEAAAVPMRVGRLSLFSSDAKRIPLWIAPFAFTWALATAVRSEQVEIIEELLDRATVGALPQKQAENLASWLLAVAENALLKLDSARGGAADRPLWERIFPGVLEALSRLLLRADSDKVIRALAVAEKTSQLKAPQYLIGAIKHVDGVFERAIRWSLPETEVLNRIPEWLALPLPSEIGGPDVLNQGRPEPLLHVRLRPGLHWMRPSSMEITHRIERLLEAVRNGNPLDRQQASLRLIVVANLGGLHRQEVRRFSEALWSKSSIDSQFPIQTNIFLTGLLRFCPLSEQDKHLLIRRAFIEHSIPPASSSTAGMAGVNWNPSAAQEHLQSLYRISRTVWTAKKMHRCTYDWTENEALALVSRASEWWEREKPHCKAPQQGFDFTGLRPVELCVIIIVDLLAECLLPRLRKLPSEQSRPAIKLLESFAESGLSVLKARPASIALGADTPAVTNKVLAELLGTDPEQVRTAIVAVRNWAYSGIERYIPPLPSQLFNAVLWKAANRAGPELENVFRVLGALIEKRAVHLVPSDIELLVTTLDLLLVETEGATNVETAMLSSESSGRFVYCERPEHRRQAAFLARSLERHLTTHKQAVPTVLTRWREACLSSPFPELRRVWTPDPDDEE